MPAVPKFGEVMREVRQVEIAGQFNPEPQADPADDAGVPGKIIVKGKSITQQVKDQVLTGEILWSDERAFRDHAKQGVREKDLSKKSG